MFIVGNCTQDCQWHWPLTHAVYKQGRVNGVMPNPPPPPAAVKNVIDVYSWVLYTVYSVHRTDKGTGPKY